MSPDGTDNIGPTRMRLYDYEASPNCYKVRLLLSHLETDYERVSVDIFAGETMTPEFLAMNPALTTPVLEYAANRYLAESAAILLFLGEGTDFLPADREERAQVHRWLFYEQSAVLPTIALLRFRLLTGRTDPGSREAERLQAMATAVALTINSHLAQTEFVAGDRFTIVDIALFGYLHVGHEAGVDTSQLASLNAWLERVRAQPRHIEDLMPYPENARPARSRSIWDAFEEPRTG